MFERLSDRARRAMALANIEAQRLNHDHIGAEHIFLGMLKEGDGVGCRALQSLGIALDALHKEVESKLPPGGVSKSAERLQQSQRAKRVIERAIDRARDLNHTYVGTEHLLLGLVHDDESIASQALAKFGVNADQVRTAIVQVLAAAETTQLPATLMLIPSSDDPQLAHLADEQSKIVSPLMRVDLAQEIARRYNLQRNQGRR